MKKMLLLMFYILLVEIQLDANLFPENLDAITTDNIENLQSIIVFENENAAAINDFVWFEAEAINTIIFGGVSGLYYLDLLSEELTPIRLESHTVYSISVNNSSRIIAVAGENSIQIIDMQTWDELHIVEHSFATSVEFSGDGDLLATGDSRGLIRVWDTDKFELLYELESEFDNAVNDLDFNEDATVLASGHQRLGIHLWNIAKITPTLTILPGYASRTIDYSFNFSSIAVGYDSSINSHTVSIWNFDTGEEIQINGHIEQTTTLVFSEDGSLLITGGSDDKLRFWDVHTTQQLFMISEHSDLVSATSINDNQTMIASSSWDGTIRIWGVLSDAD